MISKVYLCFYVYQFVKGQANRRIKRAALRRSFLEVIWKPEPIAGEEPQSYQQQKTDGTELPDEPPGL
jgi:hypothetical protein